MTTAPKLSFVVLSYNYADLIGQTLRSILAQTVQDFEVIVVDDASTDSSRDVVRSFGDDRIKLFVNERNLGGAGSYNRAIEAARGEYLVNLDADDWIPPNKCEVQLAFLEQNPVAVVGSYADFIDREGNAPPNRDLLEEHVNRPFDLNAVDSWIVQNTLVRSSTMVNRAAHLAVGLDDPSMVRAPDYELWTRFLRFGHRFAVVRQRLLYYRVHSGGVTHADPRTAFLEMYYSLARNIVPLIEQRAAWPSLGRIVDTLIEDAGFGGTRPFAALRPIERYRLLGILFTGLVPDGFSSFRRNILEGSADDVGQVTAGRRVLAQATQSSLVQEHHRLQADMELYVAARNFWQTESEGLKAKCEQLERDLAAAIRPHQHRSDPVQSLQADIRSLRAEKASCIEARDYWYRMSLAWEAAARAAGAGEPKLVNRASERDQTQPIETEAGNATASTTADRRMQRAEL